MTDAELAALAQAATPGEWEPDGDSYTIVAPDPKHCWVQIAQVSHNSRHNEGRHNRNHICAWHPERTKAALAVIAAVRTWADAYTGITPPLAESAFIRLRMRDALAAWDALP